MTILAAMPAHAVGTESVAMPFDCATDGSRLVLKPSGMRTYAVLGDREERSVNICSGSDTRDCSAVMAHRFAISCAGRRVPWMRVVAAARGSASRPLWLDRDRMFLSVERDTGRCANGPRRLGPGPNARSGEGGRGYGLPLAECLPWQEKKWARAVALPPGFAPLAEIGARIVIGSPSTAPTLPLVAAPLPSPAAPQSAPLSRPPVFAPTVIADGASTSTGAAPPPRPPLAAEPAPVARLPSVEPVPAASLAAVSAPVASAVASAVAQAKSVAPAPVVATGGSDLSLTWVTLVTPEPALESFAAGLPPALRPLATGLVAVMLGALLAAGGWTAAGSWSFAARQWSRARGLGMRARVGKARMGYVMQRIAEKLSFRRGRREPRTTTSVANAAASVTALLEKADGAIQSLERAPPLRDVLSGELIHIRQRLVIAKAQASESAEAAAKAAPAFRALVRDLERLRRISESAALSVAGRRETSRLPMTKGEAYDFLGVNADVPDATLKKLVDALRVCWHPDLARDERDRLEREERIKCINVSWELISGKRAAA